MKTVLLDTEILGQLLFALKKDFGTNIQNPQILDQKGGYARLEIETTVFEPAEFLTYCMGFISGQKAGLLKAEEIIKKIANNLKA